LTQFLFYTGCRISEALNIKIIDCIEDDEYVNIKILGKGKKVRIIKIPYWLYYQIERYYKGNIYLFETRNKKRWNSSAFYRELKRQAFKILKKHVHPHMIRHSTCSYLLNEKGINIKEISDYLGITGIKTTWTVYHHGKINNEYKDINRALKDAI
jgi:integrase/recombinase XerD